MKPKRGQFKVEGMYAMPTPIGMGALASPDDFVAAKERHLASKREEAAFDRGEIKSANELLGKKK